MTPGPVFLVLGWVFVGAGSVFLIIGGIGLLRLPDFYSRIHAAGITDTMGAWLIIVGLLFTSGGVLPHLKLVMLLIFLIITSPLASHALAKAAYLRHLEPMVGPQPNREGDDD